MSKTRYTPSISNEALYWWGLALIAAAIVSGLIEPLLTLRRLIPLDPNEGWNAFFSKLAVEGGRLYPARDSLVTNNYPPLSFFVVGIVGRATGDNILAGRVIALISMLVVAWNLYFWLRVTGSVFRIALLGAAVFLAFAVTYAHSYVAIDDPQWLAHAIMTTGLVVLWRGHASGRAIVAACVLMVAAGWTKHLLIPLPIAATFWLMRRPRPAFITWIASSGILLAATGLLLWWVYGGAFFESLATGREYSRHQAAIATATALKCFAPIVGLSMLLFWAERSERVTFIMTYLLIAALVAAVASGGAGVDINSFFDLLIAASLGAALAVEMLWSRPLRSWLPALDFKPGVDLGPSAVLLLGICLALYAATIVPNALRNIRNLDVLERTTLNDIRQIALYGQGRAACEMPGLCYWAKGSFTFDFFNYGQKLKIGAVPLSSCNFLFQGAKIPLIQLQSADRGSDLLPDECNKIIYENYRPISESSLGVLLVPRGT